jgi:tight adherence protein C
MNSLPLALGVGALVSLSCGITYWGLLKLRRAETTGQRLQRLSASPQPLEAAELDLPFLDRVLKPWLRRQIRAAGRLAPTRNIEKLRLNLARAGYPYGWTVLDFLGIKLLAAVLGAIGLLYYQAQRGRPLFQAGLFTVVGAIVAFQLPNGWLTTRVRGRRAALTRALPDALDMLSICVDAGAGLDSAMLRISQKWRNELASEFGKVVAEIRIGLSRTEALKNMVERTGVPEIGSFVAVLLQASEFGLSIAQVLHTQSEQMRTRRWQRAEEEARKVPIKLLFPLVFLIMPALFAVTIGPAVPILLRLFAQFLGG